MADFYIDVVNGASGNSGSEASPKQYISQATFSANNRVFLKRGQTHPIATYRFLASGMSLQAYGTGPRPILQKTAGSDAWIYIQNASNVILKDFCIDANGYNGSLLTLHASTGHSISNVLVQNVEVWGSPNNTGIFIQGGSGGTVRNIKFQNVISRDHYNHGFLCSVDVASAVFLNCLSYRNGLGVGAHGFSCYSATSTAPTNIFYIGCEAHSITDFDGIEGSGFQADDNTVRVYFIGCYSHNNDGAGFAFNSSSGHRLVGSLAINNKKPGLYVNGDSTNCFAYNNTFYGNSKNPAFSAEIVVNGASTGQTYSNNILKKSGSLTTGISLAGAAASGSAGNTNCIYGYSTVSSNITLSNTVETDPLIDESFELKTGSPCIGTGTQIQTRDFDGNTVFDATPDIGAKQVRTSRTLVTNRIIS